jgi:cyanate permease
MELPSIRLTLQRNQPAENASSTIMQKGDSLVGQTNSKGKYLKWMVLAIILIVQLDIQAILYGPAVLADAVRKALQISRAQFGFAMSATDAVVMLCVTLSSVLIDRFGVKRVFLYGLMVLGAGGCIVFIATNFAFLVFARAIQGVGIAIIYPAIGALIMNSFTQEEQPYINTVYAVFGFLGTGAAFVVTFELFNRFQRSWSVSLSAYGAVTLIIMVIWAFLGKEDQAGNADRRAHGDCDSAPREKSIGGASLSRAIRMRVAWQLAAGIFAVSWVSEAYFYFLPMFLHDDAGLSVAEASRLGSVLPLSGVGGVLFFGLLSKKSALTRHLLWISCSLVIVGSPCIFFASGHLMKIGLLVAGFGLCGFLPVLSTYIMALPRMTPASVAAVLVMINIAVYLAGFLSPTIVGWLSQTSFGLRHTLALFSLMELFAIVMFFRVPAIARP